MNHFIGGLAVGVAATSIIFGGLIPKHTIAYKLGVEDTYKAAFDKGYMVKEITADDKVVYKWK